MKEKCKHLFELSRIQVEFSSSANPAGTTVDFYKQVGYAVCVRCGLIRKSEV